MSDSSDYKILTKNIAHFFSKKETCKKAQNFVSFLKKEKCKYSVNMEKSRYLYKLYFKLISYT